MPRLTAAPITLTASEQAELETLVSRPSTAQQLTRRAQIILRASRGEGHGQILQEMGISKDMTRLGRLAKKEPFGSEVME
ncbi:MAG: hypothetical protein DCF32_13605, partial [Leptolyngbya sp.]